MILKELLGKIGFDVDEKPLHKARDGLEGIKSLMEAVAAAEIVKGLAEMTEKFGEMAEKIHLAAVSAGITTEAFQKLAFAAEQNGVSQDEMSGAMARITRHLYDARTGSESAQKVFSQAGFTAEQVKGFKNSSEVLHALADRFKGMKDPIKEMGILLPLAGRGSREMVAFMEQGGAGMRRLEGQAESLGAVLSGEQVEALVEAKHASSALLAVLKTLAATIAADFAPSVKDAVNEFLQFYKVNKDIIGIEVKKWVNDVAFAMGYVWGVIKVVAQAFLDFAKTHEVLVRRAGEFILALGALSTALFVLKGVFTVVSTVMSPFFAILRIGKALMFGFRLSILGVSAPFLVWVAVIGAVVVAIHDLYAVFFQHKNFKDTWIGQAIEYLKNLSVVSKGISAIKGLFGGGEEGQNTGIAAKAGNAFKNLTGLGEVSKAPQASAAAQNVSTSSSKSEVNAPISIHVPAGTDHHMVGEKVKEGVRDHLDRMHREMQRSLRSAKAY